MLSSLILFTKLAPFFQTDLSEEGNNLNLIRTFQVFFFLVHFLVLTDTDANELKEVRIYRFFLFFFAVV